MPQVFQEGHVDAHVLYHDEVPQIHCYDARCGFMRVEVVINLLTRLPDGYGDEPDDLPLPEFVIEALQAFLLRDPDELWAKWEKVRQEF